MTDIKSLTLSELTQEMESIGEKKFRAAQIYSWLHERLVDDFDEMTNLSKGLREKLKENYELPHLTLVRVQTSKIDETSKFLFRLSDGNVYRKCFISVYSEDHQCGSHPLIFFPLCSFFEQAVIGIPHCFLQDQCRARFCTFLNRFHNCLYRIG